MIGWQNLSYKNNLPPDWDSQWKGALGVFFNPKVYKKSERIFVYYKISDRFFCIYKISDRIFVYYKISDRFFVVANIQNNIFQKFISGRILMQFFSIISTLSKENHYCIEFGIWPLDLHLKWIRGRERISPIPRIDVFSCL